MTHEPVSMTPGWKATLIGKPRDRLSMLTRAELSEWIRNREDSGIEFNRQTIDKAALAKKIVAFANLQGGCILLGVDDDGSITGITREYLEAWVMTACRDKIRPEIIPYYEVLHDVEPGKHVAVVRVDRGLTVHHVWHANHRTYCIRVGSQSREASPEELHRQLQVYCYLGKIRIDFYLKQEWTLWPILVRRRVTLRKSDCQFEVPWFH